MSDASLPSTCGLTRLKRMTPAKLRLSLLVLAILLMGVERGHACTCMAPVTPADALEKSSAVFRGRVTRISRPFLDRVGIARTGNHRVEFEITKRWKGAQSKSIVVSTRLSGEACGFPFEEGKEYLIYVAPGPLDIETGICTGTKHIAGAELEMEQLDQLPKQSVGRDR